MRNAVPLVAARLASEAQRYRSKSTNIFGIAGLALTLAAATWILGGREGALLFGVVALASAAGAAETRAIGAGLRIALDLPEDDL